MKSIFDVLNGEDLMQPMSGKKAITLGILKVLEDYSDYDHPLTNTQISEKLKSDYGIHASRNTISRNISTLCEMGYDISTYESNHRGAYLAEGTFDDMELLVLIDSVLSSRYIPTGDAARIIKKLGGLSNCYFRKRIPHVQTVKEWNHQRNKEFFWSLELLSDAVEQKKQVAFTYNKPKEDGELHPLRTKKDKVHPYALVCTNGQYYLIASYRTYDNIRHYRVDRMTDIELLGKQARDIRTIEGYERGLDVAKYAAEHGFMHGGKAKRIVLKMKRECAGDVMDAFGVSAVMEQLDEDDMKVTVYAAAEGMRFFALQFASVCEVMEPKELRDAVAEDVKELCAKYGVR